MRGWSVAALLVVSVPVSSAFSRSLALLPISPRSGRSVPLVSSISASDASNKRRKLDIDFLRIAAPAFGQFAAEPLARLVDTAYLGRLGQNALGGAGAAIAAQYSVSKLYNDPLLRTTISLVAAQEKSTPEARAGAVSTALLLALVVGIVQGIAFFCLAGAVLSASLVGPSSPMRYHALGYLRVCSMGAPAATVWLAANGIFRGLGDTATPLGFALFFTAMNATLDPLFIFRFGMGVYAHHCKSYTHAQKSTRC